ANLDCRNSSTRLGCLLRSYGISTDSNTTSPSRTLQTYTEQDDDVDDASMSASGVHSRSAMDLSSWASIADAEYRCDGSECSMPRVMTSTTVRPTVLDMFWICSRIESNLPLSTGCSSSS